MWQGVIYPSINAQQISWQCAVRRRTSMDMGSPRPVPRRTAPLLFSFSYQLAAHLG